MSDKISKTLDLAPLNAVPSTALTVQPDKKELTDDIEFVRQSLYDAAVKAQSAVEDMIAIAQQSQHPKAYEVLNASIKTMADVAMGITDLQLKKQRLEKGLGPSSSDDNKTINNNLFVGSTAELQKMLEELRGGGTDD